MTEQEIVNKAPSKKSGQEAREAWNGRSESSPEFVAKMLEALEKIAGGESYHEDDFVSVARKALSAAKNKYPTPKGKSHGN